MGNNPASSVISGSDFFKENEHFSDEDNDTVINKKANNDDDEVASLMTTRTITRLGHHRQNMNRSPTMSIMSKRSYSVQCTHPRNDANSFYNRILNRASQKRSPSTTTTSNNTFYKSPPETSTPLPRLSRKTINQNRLNESFYENLTEASLISLSTENPICTNVTVEPLPKEAMAWLENAGISMSYSHETTPLTRKSRLVPPPPSQPQPPSQPSTCLVVWEPPKVVLNRRIRNLGITNADPLAYTAKFGDSLVSASNLPSIIKHIRPRNGAVLASDSTSTRLRDTIKLVGDVGALSLLKKHREQQHQQRRRFSIASDSF